MSFPESVASRFTDRAKTAIEKANEEARRLNHEWIGTEHLLLGILKVPSIARFALELLEVDHAVLCELVEGQLHVGPHLVHEGRLPHTPRAKLVIERAMEESRNDNSVRVGTLHILLGLIHHTDGIAGAAFKKYGVTTAKVRRAFAEICD